MSAYRNPRSGYQPPYNPGTPQPPYNPQSGYQPPFNPGAPQPPYNPQPGFQPWMDTPSHAAQPTTQYKGLPQWVAASRGEVPPGAVKAGQDHGEPMFVARAHHENTLTLGKLHPSHKNCYISYGGKEIAKPNYEVLVNPYGLDLSWVPAQGGNLPPGIIQGGTDNGGVPLYIGRGIHQGCQIPGKVNTNYRLCYIPYGGKEVECRNFEVLTLKSVTFY